MAKINITRIFDTARALATKPGQELSDFVTYTAEAFAQIIQALRNGLTFADNFNALVIEPEITHGQPQVLNVGTKTPTDILLTRVFSLTNPVQNFSWGYNASGQLVILANFVGSPTSVVRIRLVVLF